MRRKRELLGLGVIVLMLAAVPALLTWAPVAARPDPGNASPGVRTVVLYDGSLGTGTPDTQGFSYLAVPKEPPLVAAQSFAAGVTTLTTTLKTSDSAGYVARADRVPSLDRTSGYTLHFTIQVTAEEHAQSDKNGDGIADRAGFSVITLASDTRGIELAFWAGEVWAQNDGAAEPPPATNTLFTHGEGAAFDTTAGLIPYDLRIEAETYSLSSRGSPILAGRLRDYRAFGKFPYIVPNFLFLGDDTTTASATIRLAAVSLGVAGDAVPPTATPETSPTPTKTATPCATPTQAALWVDPVTSPTHARSQVVHAQLVNGEWIEVSAPLGTFRADGGWVAIDVPLVVGQLNRLAVTGRVRKEPGCGYGGYEVHTTADRGGRPLEILQLPYTFLPYAHRGPR